MTTKRITQTACSSATRTNDKQEVAKPNTEIRLGPALLGESWPDLDARVEVAKDALTGKKYLGIRVFISKRVLWILMLTIALLGTTAAPHNVVVKKIFELTKVLRN